MFKVFVLTPRFLFLIVVGRQQLLLLLLIPLLLDHLLGLLARHSIYIRFGGSKLLGRDGFSRHWRCNMHCPLLTFPLALLSCKSLTDNRIQFLLGKNLGGFCLRFFRRLCFGFRCRRGNRFRRGLFR